MKREHKKAAIAFTLIFGLAFLLSNCTIYKGPAGAGCENGFVGIGGKVKAMKGPKRICY